MNRSTMKLACLAAVSLLGLSSARAQDEDDQGTGLVSPTPQEIAALQPRTVVAAHANALAIARTNAERKRTGEPLIDPGLAAAGADEIATSSAAAASDGQLVSAIPSAVDNSTLPAFPPIGKQGKLNSCVAWATTYYQLSHETALARGGSNATTSSPTVFSPKWTYNLINKGANDPTSSTTAYEVLAQSGAASFSDFPYDGDYLAWDLVPDHWRRAISFRPEMPHPVVVDSPAGIAEAKQLLANGHVLCVMTHIRCFQTTTVGDAPARHADAAFVGQQAVSWTSGATDGHMMTVVGYDDSVWVDVNGNGLVDSGERGAFKVANQYGTGWGNSGFIWVAYDALKATSHVAGGPGAGRVPTFKLSTMFYSPARASYTPSILAQVTLETPRRGALALSLGVSGADAPAGTLVVAALSNSGGPHAFDGTKTPVSATFVLDFSDLVPNGDSSLDYTLTIAESGSGRATTLSDFWLDDVATRTRTPSAGGLPAVVGPGVSATIRHATRVEGPMAVVSASHEAKVGQPVTFDGSRSFSARASLVSWTWNFGDGSAGDVRPSVSHAYSTPGRYTSTLTVTDGDGRSGTATFTIRVAAPEKRR